MKRQIGLISEIRFSARVTVVEAKSIVENPDEPADLEGGGGFAEWAMLTLNALRIELGKSYRVMVDLLSEMPGDSKKSALRGCLTTPFFVRGLPNSDQDVRAFLVRSAEKRTGHAAIDSTGFDRDQPAVTTPTARTTASGR